MYDGSELRERLQINAYKYCKLISFLLSRNIDIDNLKAVGCDCTNINIGYKNGVKCLENHLNCPLQWFICLLHSDELPLVFILTFGWNNTYTTRVKWNYLIITRALWTTKVSFVPIAFVLPKIIIQNPSMDQKYFYKSCQAISSGTCDCRLANEPPGNLFHSIWFRTVTKNLQIIWWLSLKHIQSILRLYVSSDKPSD